MGWQGAVAALLVLAAACGGEETGPRARPAVHVADNAGAVVRFASLDRVEHDLGWLYRMVTSEEVASSLLQWRGVDPQAVDAGAPLLLVGRPSDWYAVLPGVDGTFHAPVPAAAAPPPLARDLPDALVSGRFDPARLGWPALGIERVEFRVDCDGAVAEVAADLRTDFRLETTPVAGILGCLPRDFPIVLAFGHQMADVARAARALVRLAGLPFAEFGAAAALHERIGGGVVTAAEFGEHGLTLVQVVTLREEGAGLADEYAAVLRGLLAASPAIHIDEPLAYELAGAQVRELRGKFVLEDLTGERPAAHVFEAPDPDAAADAAPVLAKRLSALDTYSHVAAFGNEVVVDDAQFGREPVSSEVLRRVVAMPGGGPAIGLVEPPGAELFEHLWESRPAAPAPLRWVRVPDDARLRIGASRHRKGWMLCRMLALNVGHVAHVRARTDPFELELAGEPPSLTIWLRDTARAVLDEARGAHVVLVVGEEARHETRVEKTDALTFRGGISADEARRLQAVVAAPPLAAPLRYKGRGVSSTERRLAPAMRRRMRRLWGGDGPRVRIAVRGRRLAVVLGGAPRLLPEVLATLDGGRPPPALARSLAACGGDPDLLLHVDLQAFARQAHELLGGMSYGLPPPFHRARSDEPARLWAESGETGVRVGISFDLAFLREAVTLVKRDATRGTCRRSWYDVDRFVRDKARFPESFAEVEGVPTPNRLGYHLDAWDRSLWISDLGDGRFRVGSSGPDGERGTADDIGEPYLDPPLGDVAPDAGRRWLAHRAEALRSRDVAAYVELLTWPAYRQRRGRLEMTLDRADSEPETVKRLRAIAGDEFRDPNVLWRATLAHEDAGLRFSAQRVEGDRLVVTCADGTKFELVRDGDVLRLAPERDS